MRLGFSLLRLEEILVAEQPENIVIEHLRGLRKDIGDVKSEVQTLKAEMATQRAEMATKSDLHSLRANVASDMLTMQKETLEQIVGLRRAVIDSFRRRRAWANHQRTRGTGAATGTAPEFAVAGGALKPCRLRAGPGTR